MADISKVDLNGTEYDVKDATARDTLDTLGGGTLDDTTDIGSETVPVYVANGVITSMNSSMVALGSSVNATAEGVVAIGRSVTANTDFGIAIGYNTKNYSSGFCFGAHSIVGGAWSIAGPYNATANGSCSIALGFSSYSNMSQGVALGREARATANYATAIGRGASCANANGLQLGSASYLSSLTCKVSLTTTSDIRDKADVTEIGGGATDFLKAVTAIRYVFNGREMYIDEENLSDEDREKLDKYGLCAYDTEAWAAGTKKGSRIRVGFSAQEVQTALKAVYGDSSYGNLVNDNLYDMEDVPDDVESRLSMNYEGFVPFIVKAIQELDARIAALEAAGEADE